MKFPFRLDSLTTRILLLGSVLLLVGALSRVVVLSDYLRKDVGRLTSEQLQTIANYVAADVDRDIIARRELLTHIATTLPPALLATPVALRAWLAERHAINPLFSQGFIVINEKGTIIADYPRMEGRVGGSAADRDYFKQAIHGEASIDRPVFSRLNGRPLLPMATPLRAAGGKVVGVLVGVSALQSSNFLNTLYETHIGESGGLLLIAPQHKLIIASSDSRQILQPTPEAGQNELHDLRMQGFRGTSIATNLKGVEVLSAAASVPSSGWFVSAQLPTGEAFSGVGELRSFILRNTIIILPVFIVLMILIMHRMMRPLMETARRADRMTLGEIPLEPLPVVRDDEVGHLTAAFNRVLSKLLESRAELSHMAHHDQLTGLPNRKLLADRMQLAQARAQRNQGRIAVLFLDLDGFKPINDRHGHEAGDLALCAVAERLTAVIRREDTLARVGGDEFVILLSDLHERAEDTAAKVAEKCLAAFAAPFRLAQGACALGTSIGIAIGDGSCDPDRLLIAADQAMYRAKEAGRGRYATAPDSDISLE